ncbi:unnamed protein product [Brachionus calyciflorus]|uniref:Pyridoxal phosphate homeostasis protein n=1 Tax=Brachionus calyciflorus TaxID=104777 RepID=A0A814PGI4_9BILA|nr:unnamed protein product [Brachionus calyciflorus]
MLNTPTSSSSNISSNSLDTTNSTPVSTQSYTRRRTVNKASKISRKENFLDKLADSNENQNIDRNSRIEKEIEAYESHRLDIEDKDLKESFVLGPLFFFKTFGNAYPCLSNVAKLLLSIPATSVPAESLFSIAGIIQNEQRNRLNPIYQNGQIHFGENYVNELFTKATHQNIIEQCPNIKWHFIGNLQANKINKLLTVPNLYMIETIYSTNLANRLNKSLTNNNKTLNVLIQVNTSSESQKNGIDLDSTCSLYKHILENCPNLNLKGLMTIGSLNSSISDLEINQDFQNLINCRDNICQELSLDPKSIELSMGMSNDFEKAILMGSSSVRIGSAIFGAR